MYIQKSKKLKYGCLLESFINTTNLILINSEKDMRKAKVSVNNENN